MTILERCHIRLYAEDLAWLGKRLGPLRLRNKAIREAVRREVERLRATDAAGQLGRELERLADEGETED